MRPVVTPHIDHFRRLHYASKCSFKNGLRLSYECDHSPVCGLSWIDIQYFHTFCRSYCLDNLVNNAFVTPLAEIGHTFNDLSHIVLVYFMFMWLNDQSN